MCINFKVRTKNYQKYFYCTKKKKEINYKNCKNCRYKEYKKLHKLKKKSNKLKRIESKRFSILTENLTVCYICDQNRKDDMHEIFSGSNRVKSMQWGLVIPICRICHKKWDIDESLRRKIQQEAKQEFIKRYTKEKFREEFGKNYIQEENKNV